MEPRMTDTPTHAPARTLSRLHSHTFIRYRPAGTPAISNVPFGAVTAKYGWSNTAR
jgi:hypothetical protein